MKIDNRTKWNTDDLRALITACLRSRAVPSSGLIVEVRGARSGSCGGRAFLGRWCGGVHRPGHWMTLYLPNPHKLFLEASLGNLRERFARVVDHEVAHLAGLKHADMSEALYQCTQAVPWAEGLTLRPATEPDASEVEAKKAAAHSDREQHARAMLARAETRLKRAETIAKKWRRRVAAYGRRSP